jgi:sialic acid synthase SpsE/mannose-6-phosphate isomerase-like protein (cupin superfamily)
MKAFDFKDLFVLDLANNHQGDIDHARRIIRECGEVVRAAGIRAALKFQFRDLATFVHPAHQNGSEHKQIRRFLSTWLKEPDFAVLTEEVRAAGLITMATPFDEPSVDWVERLGIDVIKIASCSAADRPLLQRILQSHKPVVASTAGLDGQSVDQLVNMLDHRGLPFAIMHCVAVYPTPLNRLKLGQIDFLKARFPEVPIGFSTHEDPNALSPIVAAVAKGASLFERHVGIGTDKYQLNDYSSTPTQLAAWIDQWKTAVSMCGGARRSPANQDELASLGSLKRGVFARRALQAGEELTLEDVYFAMPWSEGQLDTSGWRRGLQADRDYAADQGISDQLGMQEPDAEETIYQISLQVRGMLNKGRIMFGKDSKIEISHHYGLQRFREFGAVIVDCMNRDYCKKLIVVLPRQKHPYHYHKRKEETFQLLYGDLTVEINGEQTVLQPGETALIAPGAWHKFHSLDGAIFEEVSTTHYNNDSYYEDQRIARLPREQRKTELPNWEAAIPRERTVAPRSTEWGTASGE